MLSHPPSWRVPAHCVVRVSPDARFLVALLSPALGFYRPLGFPDGITHHAPYFRASHPYIPILTRASAKHNPRLRFAPAGGGGSLAFHGELQCYCQWRVRLRQKKPMIDSCYLTNVFTLV
jgi:hypothetical protein